MTEMEILQFFGVWHYYSQVVNFLHLVDLFQSSLSKLRRRELWAGWELENLEISEEEKDLRVCVNSGHNFSKRVKNAQVNKANKILDLDRHSYEYTKNIIFLFTSLVRPLFEFANSVWRQLFDKDKVLIKDVLYRGIKCVSSLNQLQYENCLEKMEIPSMSFRPIKGDLV